MPSRLQRSPPAPQAESPSLPVPPQRLSESASHHLTKASAGYWPRRPLQLPPLPALTHPGQGQRRLLASPAIATAAAAAAAAAAASASVSPVVGGSGAGRRGAGHRYEGRRAPTALPPGFRPRCTATAARPKTVLVRPSCQKEGEHRYLCICVCPQQYVFYRVTTHTGLAWVLNSGLDAADSLRHRPTRLPSDSMIRSEVRPQGANAVEIALSMVLTLCWLHLLVLLASRVLADVLQGCPLNA